MKVCRDYEFVEGAQGEIILCMPSFEQAYKTAREDPAYTIMVKGRPEGAYSIDRKMARIILFGLSEDPGRIMALADIPGAWLDICGHCGFIQCWEMNIDGTIKRAVNLPLRRIHDGAADGAEQAVAG